MKKLFLGALAVTFVAALTGPLEAQAIDPDRRALFVTILKANDCKMHNIQPAPAVIEAIQTNGFSRDEVRAIGVDLMEKGDAVRDGEVMRLTAGGCS